MMPPFKSVEFIWLAVTIVVLAFTHSTYAEPILAQKLTEGSAALNFGATTVRLSRSEVLSLGDVANEFSSEGNYVVKPNDSVFIRLPADISLSLGKACDPISEMSLNYFSLPARKMLPLFNNLYATKTEFDQISKLDPATSLELFEFESPELRDVWGDQITFYRSPPLINVQFQITPDVRLRVTTSAKQCFFQNGAKFVQQLRAFAFTIIRHTSSY
jgi:hypothetical protein